MKARRRLNSTSRSALRARTSSISSGLRSARRRADESPLRLDEKGIGAASSLFLQTASFVAALSFLPALIGFVSLWGYFTQLEAPWVLPTLSLSAAYDAFHKITTPFHALTGIYFLSFIWMKVLARYEDKDFGPLSPKDLANIGAHIGPVALFWSALVNLFLALAFTPNAPLMEAIPINARFLSAACLFISLGAPYWWIRSKTKILKHKLGLVAFCCLQITIASGFMKFAFGLSNTDQAGPLMGFVMSGFYNASMGLLLAATLYWIDMLLDRHRHAVLSPVPFVIMALGVACLGAYHTGQQSALIDISKQGKTPIAASLKEPKEQGPLLLADDSRLFVYIQDANGQSGRVQAMSQTEAVVGAPRTPAPASSAK